MMFSQNNKFVIIFSSLLTGKLRRGVTERDGLKTNVTCNDYTVIQRLNVTLLPRTHTESTVRTYMLIYGIMCLM